MIEINDNDLPITVAQKIINGTKKFEAPPLIKAIHKAISEDEEEDATCDMFTLEEIQEISDYLSVYCKAHKEGD